jgi:micrococcal nuclease
MSKTGDLIDTRVVIVSTLLTSTILGSIKLYKLFSPIRTIHQIPKRYFHNKFLRGHVTRVGDGDNFHFYHTPGGLLAGWGLWRPYPKHKRGLKTIHIRLCGIDAPERAHFGKPAQLFGDEAMNWLKGYILNQNVRVKPLCIDQYGRCVGSVKVKKWFKWRDVGQEMLKQGFCVVYEGSQVEFDGMADLYKYAESKAKKSKKGIWSLKNLQTPGEYKKLNK